MITHSIKRYQDVTHLPVSQIPKTDRPKFVAGSSAHKDYIRNSTVARSKQMFMEGDYVMLRYGSGDGGEVLGVYETEEQGVEWSGMKCRPVEVYWWFRQECQKYHPDELVHWKVETEA